ncbi:hypothetical protein JCM10207_006483 [Rhodosporidiobolus poonsookiae]
MSSNATFAFGSYDWVCSRGALIVCPLLGSTEWGIEPVCYSRNVEFGRTLVFQPATSFLHICALLMVIIMILHIRSKYTAVGRKEILCFFYAYFLEEIIAIFLDSSIIPTNSSVYPWFAAIHTGLTCATFWCLLVNGFVGFQVVEDGTPLSLWVLQGTSAVVGLIVGLIAIGTFKDSAGLSSSKPTGLWILQFIFNLACVVIYLVTQLILVIRTLDDRWPIGDIIFGTAFWVIGQVLLFAFSNTICDAVSHYLDGTFFHALCNLLAVMMVYKFWDSITKEDLEFSVGSKAAVWEVKESLLRDEDDSMAGGGYGGAAAYPPHKAYGAPNYRCHVDSLVFEGTGGATTGVATTFVSVVNGVTETIVSEFGKGTSVIGSVAGQATSAVVGAEATAISQAAGAYNTATSAIAGAAETVASGAKLVFGDATAAIAGIFGGDSPDHPAFAVSPAAAVLAATVVGAFAVVA